MAKGRSNVQAFGRRGRYTRHKREAHGVAGPREQIMVPARRQQPLVALEGAIPPADSMGSNLQEIFHPTGSSAEGEPNLAREQNIIRARAKGGESYQAEFEAPVHQAINGVTQRDIHQRARVVHFQRQQVIVPNIVDMVTRDSHPLGREGRCTGFYTRYCGGRATQSMYPQFQIKRYRGWRDTPQLDHFDTQLSLYKV